MENQTRKLVQKVVLNFRTIPGKLLSTIANWKKKTLKVMTEGVLVAFSSRTFNFIWNHLYDTNEFT